MAITNFIDRIQLGNSSDQIAIGSSAYGVCSTIASEAAKTVDIAGFTLNTGTTIHVKFTYANNAANPTLNVNNTGNKSIVIYGSNSSGIDGHYTGWQAGAVLTLTYDGTNWIRSQGFNEIEIPTSYVSSFNGSTGAITYTAPVISVATLTGEIGASDLITQLGLSTAMHFKGVYPNGIAPSASTVATDFNNYEAGDVVLGPAGKEYVFNKGADAANSAWIELGDESSWAASGHSHGNITNDGKIGTTANLALYTTTGGLITAGSLAYSDPTASGTATAFISSITQNDQGQISANKSDLPIANTSTAGIIKIGNTANDALAGDTIVTHVAYTSATDNAEYPILMKNSTSTTTTAAGVIFNTSITINPSTGVVTALGFNGPLTGNADTATAAATAAQGYIYGIAYYSDTNGTFATTTTGDEGCVLIGKGSSNPPIWYQGLTLSSTTSNNVITYLAEFNNNVNIGGILDVTGITTLNNTLDVTGNTTIGTSGTASTLEVYGDTILNSTLSVTGTSTLTGRVGIGILPDDATSGDQHILTIKGNINVKNTASTPADVLHIDTNTTTGSLIEIYPSTTNTGSLGIGGSSSHRWSKLYIGTADTYGDIYTPIYWNDGAPEEIDVVQKYNFTLARDNTEGATTSTTTIILNNTNKAKTIVNSIVIIDNTSIANLNGPIDWEISVGGNIVLSTPNTNGNVSGYILTSIGSLISAS